MHPTQTQPNNPPNCFSTRNYPLITPSFVPRYQEIRWSRSSARSVGPPCFDTGRWPSRSPSLRGKQVVTCRHVPRCSIYSGSFFYWPHCLSLSLSQAAFPPRIGGHFGVKREREETTEQERAEEGFFPHFLTVAAPTQPRSGPDRNGRFALDLAISDRVRRSSRRGSVICLSRV